MSTPRKRREWQIRNIKEKQNLEQRTRKQDQNRQENAGEYAGKGREGMDYMEGLKQMENQYKNQGISNFYQDARKLKNTLSFSDKNWIWTLDEHRIGEVCGGHFKELPSEKENQNKDVQQQGHIKREKDTEAGQTENKEIEEQPPVLEEVRIITKYFKKK